MKKIYVKPAIEVVELVDELCTLTASNLGLEGGEDSEGGMEADANRHRGEWGNLWAED